MWVCAFPLRLLLDSCGQKRRVSRRELDETCAAWTEESSDDSARLFLLFSDVLRQSYSCLMLSPLGKEAPHIHHAQRAPAPFQVSLNTLSWPGRRPDVSQSWTGSSQHSELASISSLYRFMCARVCRCYLIYSGVLCLSTELVYLAEAFGRK